MRDTSVTKSGLEPAPSSATMRPVATIEHPVDIPGDTLISLTPVAAAKVRDLLAEETDDERSSCASRSRAAAARASSTASASTSSPRVTWSSTLEGVPVVVDPYSAPYLRGTTIDFLNTIQESGFKIDNPNATASCGCGHSFTVAEGEELPGGRTWRGCGSGCSH